MFLKINSFLNSLFHVNVKVKLMAKENKYYFIFPHAHSSRLFLHSTIYNKLKSKANYNPAKIKIKKQKSNKQKYKQNLKTENPKIRRSI